MKINTNNLIIILPFICFITGYVLCSFFIGNKTYTTPKLTGITLYEAIKITSPHQINIRILSEKESSHIPASTILSQKPSPGRLIKAHQPILVTTTKSPPKTIAPHLIGQKKDAFDKVCHDLNIKTKVYHIEYPAQSDSCIAQLPQSSEYVHDNKMTLYLAQNKTNMYLMPNLTNQSLASSLELLNNYTDKINIFIGSQKIRSPYPDDAIIIHQKPLAGSLVSIQPAPMIQLEIA